MTIAVASGRIAGLADGYVRSVRHDPDFAQQTTVAERMRAVIHARQLDQHCSAQGI
jgi:hypothetical protein